MVGTGGDKVNGASALAIGVGGRPAVLWAITASVQHPYLAAVNGPGCSGEATGKRRVSAERIQ
jgi:hypothetical protein